MGFPSEEQKRAIEGCVEELRNKRSATLIGPAGSGKSSVASEILKRLRDYRVDVVLTAMTNQAARSLETAIYDSSGMLCSANTIHSFLGLKPAPQGLIKQRKDGTANCDNYKGIVLLDEVSMLDSLKDQSLWNWISRSKNENPNLVYLYVGDKYQLPPINETISIVFTKEVDVKTFALTEVFRQPGSNPVAWIANKFRLAQDGEQLDRLRTEVNDVNHGVIKLSRSQYDAAAIQSMGRAKFLSFTNRCAIYYDRMIRNEIVKAERHVVEGEQLVANEAFIDGDEVLIGNCEEVEVVDVDYGKRLYDIPYTSVDVKCESGLVTCMLPEDEMYKRKMIDARWKRSSELRKMGKEDESKSMIVEAKAISTLFSDLRYGYGMTVHKSQGQTIDNVFIDLENISMMRDPIDILKSCYVAFSRARRRVYYVGDLKSELYSKRFYDDLKREIERQKLTDECIEDDIQF